MNTRTGVRARLAAQDDAADKLEALLIQLGDAIESRLRALLGGNADALTELSNPVPLDEQLANLRALAEQPQAVRIGLLAVELGEVEEWINALGLNNSRRVYFEEQARMEAAIESHLTDLGLPGVSSVLDDEGIRAVVSAFQGQQDGQLFGTIRSTSATRVLDAMKANAELLTDAEFAKRVAEAHDLTVPTAMTEARTRLAEADRFIAEEVVQKIERDEGLELLRAYTGPLDGKTRPFCSKLVGKAFDSAQVSRLNNAQVGNPLETGGGYNCRHVWEAFEPDEMEEFGFSRGTESDVSAANSAARSSRVRKGRGRRR